MIRSLFFLGSALFAMEEDYEKHHSRFKKNDFIESFSPQATSLREHVREQSYSLLSTPTFQDPTDPRMDPFLTDLQMLEIQKFVLEEEKILPEKKSEKTYGEEQRKRSKKYCSCVRNLCTKKPTHRKSLEGKSDFSESNQNSCITYDGQEDKKKDISRDRSFFTQSLLSSHSDSPLEILRKSASEQAEKNREYKKDVEGGEVHPRGCCAWLYRLWGPQGEGTESLAKPVKKSYTSQDSEDSGYKSSLLEVTKYSRQHGGTGAPQDHQERLSTTSKVSLLMGGCYYNEEENKRYSDELKESVVKEKKGKLVDQSHLNPVTDPNSIHSHDDSEKTAPLREEGYRYTLIGNSERPSVATL